MLALAVYVLWPEGTGVAGNITAAAVMAGLMGNLLFMTERTAGAVHSGALAVLWWAVLAGVTWTQWPGISGPAGAALDAAREQRWRFAQHEAIIAAAIVAARVAAALHNSTLHILEGPFALVAFVLLASAAGARDGFAGAVVGWATAGLWLVYRVTAHTQAMFVLGTALHTG
jgi:hypothetical protein